MARTSTSPDEVVPFAGLTRHNNVDLSDKAAEAVQSDHASDRGIYPDEMPETSLSTALNNLETAQAEEAAWKVPDKIADRLNRFDLKQLNNESPDGVTFSKTEDGRIFVTTDRRQAIVSPKKLAKWVQGEYRREDTEEFYDPLWSIPSKDYTVVNPMDFYQPLQEALREQDLGDNVFGTVRTYKGGGEVHMELLFDCFKIENPDAKGATEDGDAVADGGVGGHILLGIRTGYDFFGGTALYAEGFAQDTWCSNSIRNVTEEKTRRHVGDTSEVRKWWDEILAEMDLMTDRLASIIEQANNVTLDYLDFEFRKVMSHDDDLLAFYEVSGFPTYLAREAASHVRSRADDAFEPTMWDIHSGATYAVTHHYRGGENTSRLKELVQVSNDLLMNPLQAVDQAENNAEQRAARARRAASGEDGSDGAGELDDLSFSANVEKFKRSIADQREEFQTQQEELQQMLVGVGEEEEDDQ